MTGQCLRERVCDRAASLLVAVAMITDGVVALVTLGYYWPQWTMDVLWWQTKRRARAEGVDVDAVLAPLDTDPAAR